MDWTQVSHNAGRFFTVWVTRDAQDRAQTHLIKCQIQSLSCPILTQSLRSNSSLVAQLVKDPPAIQGTLVRLLGRKIPWKRDRLPTPVFLGFLGSSDGKESACNVRDLGRFLCWEDPLEKGMATHSSILTWRIAMDRGPWWATVPGVTKSQTQLSD